MRAVTGLLALSITLALCRAASLARPTPTGIPTLTVTSTPMPEPTPTSTLRPSVTWRPPPSVLPSLPVVLLLSPTPTPTRATHTPSPTPTLPAELDCRLDWQSPRNGVEFDPDDTFSAGWKVTNTGLATWTTGRVEFTYVSGAKLHTDPVVQLKSGVAPGGSVVLTVDMKVPPRRSTSYTTHWALREEDIFFCRVKLSFYVE